jgi:hypothetical protein
MLGLVINLVNLQKKKEEKKRREKKIEGDKEWFPPWICC